MRRQWLIDACGAFKQIFVPAKQDRVNWFWYLNPKVGMGRRGDNASRASSSCHGVLGGRHPALTMSKSETIIFNCPRCEAEYKIVSIEAPRDIPHEKIARLKCDALFPAGEGRMFFKYFLVGRPNGRFSKRR